MSTEWAVPTEKRIIQRKQQDERNKDVLGKKTSRGDIVMRYCTTCKVVFQTSLYDPRRKGMTIDIYEDFPSIGKKRVDSCMNCEKEEK